LPCVQKVTISSLVTELNVAKFMYNLQKSLSFNILKLEMQFSKPFRNASAKNEGEVGNYFALKLVAKVTSFERSSKEG